MGELSERPVSEPKDPVVGAEETDIEPAAAGTRSDNAGSAPRDTKAAPTGGPAPGGDREVEPDTTPE